MPDDPTRHQAFPKLVSDARPANVLLVGCGGNGTAMLHALVKLHRALRGLGSAGLDVALCDGADVREANLGRQPFARADVGKNKAVVLAHRVNMSYGFSWSARPEHLTGEEPLSSMRRTDVIVSCVDTREARRRVFDVASSIHRLMYTLDLGNADTYGQVALGTHRRTGVPLPTAETLWPEIADPSAAPAGEDEGSPSCSSAEALRRQDLFVHDVLAAQGANLLWRLFRDGSLTHHGAFCNLVTGATRPIPVPAPEAKETPTGD